MGDISLWQRVQVKRQQLPHASFYRSQNTSVVQKMGWNVVFWSMNMFSFWCWQSFLTLDRLVPGGGEMVLLFHTAWRIRRALGTEKHTVGVHAVFALILLWHYTLILIIQRLLEGSQPKLKSRKLLCQGFNAAGNWRSSSQSGSELFRHACWAPRNMQEASTSLTFIHSYNTRELHQSRQIRHFKMITVRHRLNSTQLLSEFVSDCPVIGKDQWLRTLEKLFSTESAQICLTAGNVTLLPRSDS